MSDPVPAEDFTGDAWVYNPQWGDPDPNYVVGQTYYSYTNVEHTLTSTSHDVSNWRNGAEISFHYRVIEGDWTPQIFRIKNPAGNVIAGNLDNITEWEGDRTYTISYEDLQTCIVNGECQLTIEYRTPPTAITEATLTKIATQ
jgi:hypothetical protein